MCPFWVLVKLCQATETSTLSVSASLTSLHLTVAPNNCGLISATLIERRFEYCYGYSREFQLALHQMRGDKPPRQKRGNRRRLAGVSVFADMGVEPSPLFEWRIFGTFVSGQKYRKRIIIRFCLSLADIK